MEFVIGMFIGVALWESGKFAKRIWDNRNDYEGEPAGKGDSGDKPDSNVNVK